MLKQVMKFIHKEFIGFYALRVEIVLAVSQNELFNQKTVALN